MNLASKLLLNSIVKSTLLLIEVSIWLPIVFPKNIMATKKPTQMINNPLTNPAKRPNSLLKPLIIGIRAMISAEKMINQVSIHSIKKHPIKEMALMIIFARYPATYSSNKETINDWYTSVLLLLMRQEVIISGKS